MPILHLGPLQLEVRRRPFAGMMIPSVGEQYTADIQNTQVIAGAFFIVFSSVDRIIAATGCERIPGGSPRPRSAASLAP
jgi:hypothetical protein